MSGEENKLKILRMSNEESNRVTRESLQGALIYLMRKKSIDQITVTELVKKSGVSRSAFYRNYKCKEDIIKDFASNVLEIIRDSLNNSEYQNNHYEWFKFLFFQIKSNEKLFRLLQKTNTINFEAVISEEIKENFSNLDNYRYLALQTGLEAVIIRWINTGFQESLETMANLCLNMFKQVDLIL